ncbi:MAG: U32 family peptidase [Acholeplasmatales bacterium]|nr:U32 family peptidase [Acholeplasmatales bacterium]
MDIRDLCDGVVVNTKYSISVNPIPNDEELIQIIEYCTANGKLCIIDISSIMENKEIEDVEAFIKAYKDKNVSFLYTDIGVHEILKGMGIEDRGIYDPKTLVTNSYDMNLYLLDNMQAVGLSNEITLDDVKKMIDTRKGKVWLKVFGYHQMFYSKRKLISVYYKYKGIDEYIPREEAFLKEETRDDLYHIDENAHGTVVYRSYVLSYLRDLDKIKDADYIYLDSAFIDEEDFALVLKVYNKTLSGDMYLDDALDYLNEMFSIEDGFMYHDTVYKKEELK